MSSPKSASAVLVDASWIGEHLEDPGVRLIELDVSPAAYEQGHIPGAVFWNAYGDLRDSQYKPVKRAELGRLLSSSGVGAETTLVFYGYGAALGFWSMKAHGHGDVRMFASQREDWPEAGGAWSREVPELVATEYRFKDEDPAIQASRAQVEAAIGDPGQILLDVRAEAEYSGERFWPSGASADVGRAGHLPGSINIPIDLLREEDGSLRAAEELRRVFDQNGVSDDKEVILYCTIANRASQAWFGLSYLLGHPRARVYYGSWVEWGKEPDTLIEAEAGPGAAQ